MYEYVMRPDPKVVLTPNEASDVLTVLAMFGALLLGDVIEDDVLPDGSLGRLGVEPGPGAAHALHARVENLIAAVRRDLDKLG